MNEVAVTMDYAEFITILRCIGKRQELCRYIKNTDPNFKIHDRMNTQLERIKMKLAGQLPAAE